MNVIAAIGAALWPLLRMLAPAMTPKLTLAGIAALGLLVSHGALYAYVRVKAHDEKVYALLLRDLEWKEEIEKEKEAHAAQIKQALDKAAGEPATPADAAQRLQLCRKSPTCRDGR
jgi:hypothetical protein